MSSLAKSKWASVEPEVGPKSDAEKAGATTNDKAKEKHTQSSSEGSPVKSQSVNKVDKPATPVKSTPRAALLESRWASASPSAVPSSPEVKHAADKKDISVTPYSSSSAKKSVKKDSNKRFDDVAKKAADHEDTTYMSPKALAFARRLGIPGGARDALENENESSEENEEEDGDEEDEDENDLEDSGISEQKTIEMMNNERERNRAKKLANSRSLDWNKKSPLHSHSHEQQEHSSRKSSYGSIHGPNSSGSSGPYGSNGSLFSSRSGMSSASESGDDLFSHRLPSKQKTPASQGQSWAQNAEKGHHARQTAAKDRELMAHKDKKEKNKKKGSKDVPQTVEISEEIRAKAAEQYQMLASGDLNWDDDWDS